MVASPQSAVASTECVTAGNMSRARLISLVGELKMDAPTMDYNPLTLPAITETFDVICEDRNKVKYILHRYLTSTFNNIHCSYRSVALSLKQALLPGRKGMGRAKFQVWEAEFDTSHFSRTAKVLML